MNPKSLAAELLIEVQGLPSWENPCAVQLLCWSFWGRLGAPKTVFVAAASAAFATGDIAGSTGQLTAGFAAAFERVLVIELVEIKIVEEAEIPAVGIVLANSIKLVATAFVDITAVAGWQPIAAVGTGWSVAWGHC